ALVLILAGSVAGQDREKKTYELLYEDVQLLKQQVQRLDKKIDTAAEDLRRLKDQLGEMQALLKGLQTEQAKTGDGVRAVPAQYQALTERLGQLETLLIRMAEDMAALKAAPTGPEAKPPDESPAKKPRDKETPAKAKSDAGQAETPAKPPSTLSANNVYDTAQADYSKGNYDLAIDGFTMYRESFPASPQADNAVYMIGECYYSQKKYQRAIDALDDLIITWPLSDKIEAAHLKKGFALAELKKKDEAIGVLKYLITRYPISEEARQAQEKLKELQER
ncbi:MAG: outer membrane protein assembly factor BamD, partial [Acidobacteriota bacterium]|nr:outer membrane protein assembly factor BamD [Acidobacteriota bacterium]